MDNSTGTGKVKQFPTGPSVAKFELQLMNVLTTENHDVSENVKAYLGFLYVKIFSEVMHLECIISVYEATTSRGGRLASPG